ncbi:MAG: alginate export family protein, partial [Cycloclasticus sp.]
IAISSAIALSVAAPLSYADSSPLIAPEYGKLTLDTRLRYEDVDDDSAAKDADAFTLRARLGYLTPDFAGFKAFAELESTVPLGDREYRDLRGHGAGYSVIADPDNNELNRGWISYSGFEDTLIKFGRQRIIFDNARFVGNVGWRQNEQTFDALTLANTSLQDTKIVVGYIDTIKTILGTNVEADIPLVNVKYSGLPFGDLSAYGYFIDYDDSTAIDRDTIGLRFKGATAISDSVKVLYTAEYAQQEIDRATLSDEEVDYYFLEGGLSFAGITAKISHEVQEGSNGVSFRTPLGTNHAFNGWADQFLGTPGDGLEDTFVTLSTKVAGVKLALIYHEFDAEDSSIDYGDELDFVAVKKINSQLTVLAKYATYSRGDVASGKSDKDKFWLQAEMKF